MNLKFQPIIRTFLKPAILLVGVFSFFAISCKGPSSDLSADLESGFQSPPESAKPRVWWHWMNGNIAKEGIKEDLLWMKRVGIGGFQNFDAALSTPQIVDKRLVYMTPEWKDAFLFTTKLADSLGLEMAIAGSPGWSESGGPWVKPEEAMKKIVWSEIRIEGGAPFTGTLPKPPTASGSFQNLGSGGGMSLSGGEAKPVPEFYADVAVVAYRIPENDISLAELKPKVTSSGGSFTLDQLTDGDLVKSVLLPAAKPDQKSWIQFEFANPQTIQSLTAVLGGASRGFGGGGSTGSRVLESSNDGKTFEKIIDITSGKTTESTITFAPVTAKYFRIAITTPAPQPTNNSMSAFFGGSSNQTPAPAGLQIAEVIIHPVARINRFEEKAGFSASPALYAMSTLAVKPADVIKKDEVIDLTSSMSTDGTLTWNPPAGKWIIQRFGYSLTGHQNNPASPEATGLEVDKLNSTYVTNYFTNYLDQYKDATGGLMGTKGLQYVITDSWEAGAQNWTDNMIADFKNISGYDILPWLPAISGHIVESAEASDKFLWDFRKTISDLVTENHYNLLTRLLKERGMGRYTESHEDGRAFIGDGMEIKSKSDIPMSATWVPGNMGSGSTTEVQTRFKADVRESASVAHIYGQNLVAAESMTAIGNAWGWAPETLKPTADMELASGLNRFVVHTSVHQPVTDKIPGLGLGPFGQWFTRHETWGELALPWTTYLARSSYMLQQGKFIADVIYYYGENDNITALFANKMPDVPASYNYDFVNADALKNILSVQDGQIVTPSGMSYKVLALDQNAKYMSLPVLRKIDQMVEEGAVVIGDKPVSTPSLADGEAEFTLLVDKLWGTTGENVVGKGKVFSGKTIEEVLAILNIAPDFSYTKPQESTNLLFVHRKLDDIDIYWVNNRNTSVEDLVASFRVEGKSAEIWHPETGKIELASYNIENGITSVPLHLESSDAVFVVFRDKAKGSSVTIAEPKVTDLASVDGQWNLSFQAQRGAPAAVVLDQLTAWNESSDPGIKYFSGTGTYTKTVQASADWFKEGSRIWLDLGSVKNLAEVIVNGQSLGIVWKTPFRIDITDKLKQGENNLEVKVTNLWVNRLIGDQQPGVTEKITYTTQAFYQAGSPLMASGLLGPVKLLSISEKE